MGNSTPCKIVTPENIIFKLCTRDYVGEITRYAIFGFNRYSGGFSPNRRNITTLWLFFDCSVLTFFLDPTPRSNRWIDFQALWRRVSAQGWSFWGLKRWVTILGEICPQNSPKMGVNKQFQANKAKCNKKLIRRWDSERELSLRRHRTRDTKYNRLLHKFRHRSTRPLCVGTYVYQIQWNNAMQRPLRRSRSFKVTDFSTNRKLIYDFLLVINTNLHPILHRFQVTADYSSNFR